jgi:hypothetical protein
MRYLIVILSLFAGALSAQDLTLEHLQEIRGGSVEEAAEFLEEAGWTRDGSAKSWFYGKEKQYAENWVDIKSNSAGENYVVYLTNENSTYIAIKNDFKESGKLFKSKIKDPDIYYSYKSETEGGIFKMRKENDSKYGSYLVVISALNGFDSLWEQYKNQ